MGAIVEPLRRMLGLEGPYPLTAARLVEALGGRASAAGRSVTPELALSIPAVYAAVRTLTDSLASLPLLLYRQVDGGKERATDHPLYRILHEEPNRWMTPYQVKELIMLNVLIYGNAYCEIERGSGGEVVGLWPLLSSRMQKTEVAASGDLLYTYQLPSRQGGGLVELPQARIFHLRGLSSDGVIGYSPVSLHREALGLTLAIEEYGARFFSNSARPGGVLQSKNRLSEGAIGRMRESWEAAHRGLSEAWRVAILEEGVEFKQVALSPDDAQLPETRQFQTTEISRIFRVPPHKLSDLNRATYSNIDKQEQQFKGDSLEPWCTRIEEQVTLALLTPPERRRYVVEFLLDAQWRADIKTRYGAYAQGIQWGYLSPNDVRRFENMNPIDGGDEYLRPANMAPYGGDGSAEEGGEAGGMAGGMAGGGGDDIRALVEQLQAMRERIEVLEG